ncbi:MAG: hypothetical protein KC731_31165, partial [Myxococcales bacterium]|nr:hypothetical protein [Myxococcales bacterium]
MSTSNPPPSSIQRAVELDRVRDVMLLDGEEQLRVDPIARQQGEKAPRARLEGQLRQCRLEGDRDTERVLSLEAARIHFENAFDVDMAVQLLHRALEIRDDEELRMQLARQLAAMGRHIEAGHVLRDGEPSDAVAVFTAWLESGEAYARGGDAEEAVATFRETAMVAPDDPIPFARIASVAYWTSGMVPRERAADAWLEGAKRQEPGSKEHFACIIRAFEVAPAYARSAEAYTSLLNRTGRSAEADELWRVYALASGHVGPVAKRRTEVALQSGDFLRALGATLEANLAPRTHSSVLPSLTELLARAPVREWIGAHTDDADAFCQRLTETVLEKRGRDRAESLRELAIRLAGEPKALLLVYAAECFAAAGESGRATGTARHACSLAPWLPRAQAALFEIAGAETPVEELERALAHLPARGALHRVLAERYLGEGRSDLALAFSRRVVDLRPGDLQPLLAHLHCAMAAEEPQVLADAIAVALESPRPWRELGPGVAVALDALLELDRPTALAMASQVLSTIGPGEGDLYRSIRAVASRCGDGVLELAATLGHAIGDEVDDEARAPVYLEAVDLSLAYGDVEGAAVHVSRAAAHSGPVEDLLAAITKVRAAIAALDPGARSDARISLARAVAWTAEQQDQDSAVEAWRHLGALRWDLADDRTGSEEAFFVACAIEPESGPYRYSVDLVDRAGPRDAVRMIVDRAASARDDGASLRLVAKLYAAASRIAADEGMVESALEAAVNAVRCDPARADAVAVVEKFAHGDQGLAALNEVYNLLAEAALGRYGYRAAHYRAARQLETRGAFQDALRHAVAAFEAVPSVGASYKMLLRLATRAGNEAAAVHALTAVASEFPIEGQIAWLLRAVEVAARSGTGAELLTELMLKALSLGPSAEVADRLPLLGRAIADDVVDERVELLQQRLTRAVTEALPRLEGPAGADVAIRLAVGVSGWLPAELPVAALLRAVAIDPHDADYTAVLDHVEDLVEDPARARELLEAVNERRSDRRPLSASLKELVSRLYLSLSEVPPASRPNAFTEAAPLAGDEPPDSGDLVTERPPDDLPLAPVKSEADDEVLFAERFDALEDHEGRPSDPEGRVKVTLQSQRPPSTKSRPTEAEENDPLASLPAEDEDDLGHEGEPSDWPSDGDPFDYSPASEAAARRRGDHAAIARMLAARAAETDNLEQRRLIRLRRAAVLEQRLGRLDDACEELERIIKEVGEDPTALRYLADLSERRKHYARGAKLWLRASQQATDVDEKIRDVVRCGEALVAAGKLETAQKLLEAARG